MWPQEELMELFGDHNLHEILFVGDPTENSTAHDDVLTMEMLRINASGPEQDGHPYENDIFESIFYK